MLAQPVPSDFETVTNATYDALMWALSRPGLPRDLPVAGADGIAQTLLDRECAVFCEEPQVAEVVAKTGAALVAPEAADHVFAGRLDDLGLLEALKLGSDLYPDDGATLVCSAQIAAGAPVRFTGPGCDGSVEVRLGGLPEGFWQARARRMRYPMGFEVFFVDGTQVVGLPRSTVVEDL